VVSAIGHEGDRPLCDEVADLRCGTPSIAAAAVIPDRTGLQATLDGRLARAGTSLDGQVGFAGRRLAAVVPRRALGQGVAHAAERLDRLTNRMGAVHPGRRLAECRARLGAPDWRRPTWEMLARAEGRLGADLWHLRALSPARTLERGYAVVTGPDGSVLRTAASVEVGDAIDVRLAEGRLQAAVTKTEINVVDGDHHA
jgi:exodeoxyribonuclease VII large subunit